MKIAVLADIHANFVALQAVAEHIQAWHPDRVIVAGDVVNRGPRPLECLRFIQEKSCQEGWLTVRGNHEDYVISHAQPDAPRLGPAFEVHLASYWTYQRLHCDVSALEQMPFQQSLAAPDGGEVRVVHASMLGIREGIYPETSERTLRRLIAPPPSLLCVGHTHRPLVRCLERTLVVNAGSAGLPFDGDTRPSYAQLTWHQGRWEAKIIRLEYDRLAAERDFIECGYLPGAGPLAQLVLIELREARSQLFQWATRYQDAALAGKISMQDSVSEFLA